MSRCPEHPRCLLAPFLGTLAIVTVAMGAVHAINPTLSPVGAISYALLLLLLCFVAGGATAVVVSLWKEHFRKHKRD